MTTSTEWRVLVLSRTDITRDPRPMKQVRVLKDNFHVTTASFGPMPTGAHEHIELERLPPRKGFARIPGIFSLLELLHLYRLYEALDARTQSPVQRLKGLEWDLIIAHDLQTLPIAARLTSRYGILVDMHEYAPEQDKPTLMGKLLTRPHYRWLCRARVRSAVAVTTVSQGIADEYARRFGIDATVVVNATPFHNLEPTVVSDPLRLVHSGTAAPDRRLDVLIEGVLRTKSNVTLDLYLLDDFPEERVRLKRMAGGDSRIHFHAAVDYEVLVPTLNRYDLGLIDYPPTSFNIAWCLPNKFFDFIQARLGVVIGPSPEMSRYVSEFDLGAVAADFTFESLARTLDSITAMQVARWKNNSHENAERLAGEYQAEIWADIVTRLLRDSQ